jgi:hypothetical protein
VEEDDEWTGGGGGVGEGGPRGVPAGPRGIAAAQAIIAAELFSSSSGPAKCLQLKEQ